MKRITIAVVLMLVMLLMVPAVTYSSECETVWLPIMIPIYNVFTGEVTWVQIGVYPVQDCQAQ